MEWHDLVGSAGVLLILCAYFALQAERLAANSLAYSCGYPRDLRRPSATRLPFVSTTERSELAVVVA